MLPLFFVKEYQNCTTKFDYNTQIKEGLKMKALSLKSMHI